jgi:DNA-binding PadR family transcriptional regulator
MKCLKVDVEMTSALQDAILGTIAVADPVPVDATEVFFKVRLHEEASLPQFVDALMELKDQGLITFLGHDHANRLFRLTESGKLYVSELIIAALRAMSATGKLAEA